MNFEVEVNPFLHKNGPEKKKRQFVFGIHFSRENEKKRVPAVAANSS